jgi:CheY-like chemotaxis protein
MSLVGRLEDLPLSDILQLIHLSGRTGILEVRNSLGRHILAFGKGKLVYASSDAIRINLPELLVEMGKVERGKLGDILIRVSDGEGDLVPLLMNEGIVSGEVISGVAREYFQAVIQNIISSGEGEFSFALERELVRDKLGYEPGEIILPQGLSPQELLLPEAKEKNEDSPELVRARRLAREFFTKGSDGGEVVRLSEKESKERVAVIEQERVLPEELVDLRRLILEDKDKIKVTEEERHLVLLEEDRASRGLLADYLGKQGFVVHAVDAVSLAGELVKRLASEDKDIALVTDLIIPSFDREGYLGGLDLLERLKQENFDIPVIIMTEHLDVNMRHKAYLLGATNYLFKPNTIDVPFEQREFLYVQFAEELSCILRRLFDALGKARFLPDSLKKRRDEGSIRRQIRILKEMVEELKQPENASQISLLALRIASEVLERAFLFLVKTEEYIGVGGFGLKRMVAITDRLRRIKIPLFGNSIFDILLKTKRTYKGEIIDTKWNRYLISELEGVKPREVVAVPILSKGKVIAILYGDNADSGEPIENIEGIEIFMSQVGIAFENAVLERKLKSLLSSME